MDGPGVLVFIAVFGGTMLLVLECIASPLARWNRAQFNREVTENAKRKLALKEIAAYVEQMDKTIKDKLTEGSDAKHQLEAQCTCIKSALDMLNNSKNSS